MCGLVGVAGDVSYRWKDIFAELLIVDVLRGHHSTGVGVVERLKEEMEVLKKPGVPHNVLTDPGYKPMIDKSIKCIIGHNRFATFGAHTEENAHPFMFDHTLGAHNGTLDLRSVRQFQRHDEFGTDSAAIFANIDEHGLRDTVDKLEGAWALTWYSKDDNTINFLRNEKRPLTYCYSKDRCTLLWASEELMLEYVLARHKIEIFDDQFFAVSENMHFSWEIPDVITKAFDAPSQKEMKPPPRKYGYIQWMGGAKETYTPFKGTLQTTNTSTSQPSVVTDLFTKRISTKRFRPPYKYPNGHIMNKKDFNRMIADGCCFCSNNVIDWGEFIHPISTSQFVCEECYNDDGTFELIANLA